MTTREQGPETIARTLLRSERGLPKFERLALTTDRETLEAAYRKALRSIDSVDLRWIPAGPEREAAGARYAAIRAAYRATRDHGDALRIASYSVGAPVEITDPGLRAYVNEIRAGRM
jgi:hypothetical protein